MRHSKAIAATGTLRTNAFGVRQVIILIAAAVALVWAGAAFAQEAWVSHGLSQEVAAIRQQNAQLAAQNQGYRKDVQTMTSGAADEEEARQNGYARANERLYLVAPPPTPSPAPSPKASPSASPRSH